MFIGEDFTDKDKVNFMDSIWDKVTENKIVVKQFINNSKDQIMLGGYPDAAQEAMFDAKEAFEGMTMHLLSHPKQFKTFIRLMLDTKLLDAKLQAGWVIRVDSRRIMSFYSRINALKPYKQR